MSEPPLHDGRVTDPAADSSERTYALFNHLIGLLSLASSSVPIPGLIGTIIMWRIKCKESPFLDDHGREAVNFQISLLVYVIGGVALGVALSVLTLGLIAVLMPVFAGIGVIGLVVLTLVGCIRGAMAANRREYYRYPMCIRFIDEPDSTA